MALEWDGHWNGALRPAWRSWDLGWLGREAFFGVAVAALLGLAVGAAVKPTSAELGQGAAPMEPTTLSETSGEAAPDNAYAAYHGRLPDYVIGTDWAHPKLPVAYEPPPALSQPLETAEASPPLPTTPARYEEPPEPAAPLPSQGGDMLAHQPPAQDPPADPPPN